MKGVILAGGLGTRVSPATKFTNKHLLPIYSKFGAVPMIFYPINTFIRSGIKEILIISSKEYCGNIIQTLGDGSDFGADFTYKIQDPNSGLGIASAIKLSEKFTCGEKFAVLLGDNFYEDDFSESFSFFLKSEKSAAIFLKETESPEQFGVYFNNSIEEKPLVPKSKLAVTGLYLYSNHVYSLISSLSPSSRGEFEVSDLNNFYCKEDLIKTFLIKGFWGDMGTPQGIIKTQSFIDS